jgi:hypothetical protein
LVAFDGDIDEVAPTVEDFRECYPYVAARSVELTATVRPTG